MSKCSFIQIVLYEEFVGTCEEDDNQRMIHDFVEMNMYSYSGMRNNLQKYKSFLSFSLFIN